MNFAKAYESKPSNYSIHPLLYNNSQQKEFYNPNPYLQKEQKRKEFYSNECSTCPRKNTDNKVFYSGVS